MARQIETMKNDKLRLLDQVNDLENKLILAKKEIENLKDQPLNIGSMDGGPPSGDLKQLQAKVKYYEKMLHRLEKERSELKTRALTAEAELKTVHAQLARLK